MSLFRFSAVVLLFAIVLVSCQHKGNAQQNLSLNAGKPVIEFRRTACFGTCPIYRFSVSNTGAIQYEGKNFTPKIGTFQAAIPQSTVTAFLQKAEKIDYWKMDTLYVTGATDLPSMVLTLRNKGKQQTVRTEGEGPEALLEFMKAIDEAVITEINAKGKAVK